MKDRIINYIKSGHSGLYITSPEEVRVENTLREVLHEINKNQGEEPFTLHLWSCTEGLVELSANPDEAAKPRGTDEPLAMLDAFAKAPPKTVFVARDFHLFTEDRNPVIWRKIKDVLAIGKANAKTLVILGCRYTLPPELEREIVLIESVLPTREQLRELLHHLLENNGQKAADLGDSEAGIIAAASGLTLTEAENAFALSLVELKRIDPEIVYREKCLAVKKNGLLEVVDSQVTLDDIGGLDNLKKWLLERRDAFSEEARAYGLDAPRGFLAVGNPGTGKTLTAKACRSVFGVPLLRLDAAKLFGSLVGQTESNWRAVHATAKAMAPCILHIDEVDGAMSGGASSGQTDGGTTSRVIKSILQDMQDNSQGIIYVLTANDVDNLPAPLLRRVDEVWNVELPNASERKTIWAIQIKRGGRKPEKFDLDKLSAASVGYSGAEIEKLVSQAKYRAFADGKREPTTDDLLKLMEIFSPLSKTMAADIERRTKRLEGVAKLASGSVEGVPSSAKPNGRRVSFARVS